MIDGSFVGNQIGLGYRVARKFLGSFWIVTQGPMDFALFKETGTAILANCAFKFWLKAQGYKKAKEEGYIQHDDFMLHMQGTVKSPKGLYSEILLEVGDSWGIIRFVIDQYNFFVYCSDGPIVAEIKRLVEKENYSYDAAIREMMNRSQKV